jgi:hypothetical protein
MQDRQPRTPHEVGLFTADNLHDPRYVWDPTVHKFFGEDLYYFILKLEEPTIATTNAIDKLCRAANIKAYSVYRLLGYYDCIVRVWCTREARDELSGAMRRQYSTAHIVEFLLYKAYFDWSPHNPEIDDRLIQSYEKDIKTVCGQDQSASELKQALRRLTHAQLLHYQNAGAHYTPRDEPLIKIYCLLVRTAGSVANARINQEQVLRATQRIDGLKLKSVYFGDGNGVECIVKAIIRAIDYPRLDDWIQELYEGLRQHGQDLRPETLLISSTSAKLPDIPDLWGEEVGTAGRRLNRMLGSNYVLSDLRPEERRTVLALFEHYRADLINTPFERYFLGIIEARLAEDENLLNEKLTFIQTLETLLRAFFERSFFPNELGKNDWHSIVRDAVLGHTGAQFDAAEVLIGDDDELILGDNREGGNSTKGARPARLTLTLGQYLFVTRQLQKEKRLRGVDLEEVLGVNWSARLQAIVELRNAWAHGTVGKRLGGAAWPHWNEVAGVAFDAGVLYNELLTVEDERRSA